MFIYLTNDSKTVLEKYDQLTGDFISSTIVDAPESKKFFELMQSSTNASSFELLDIEQGYTLRINTSLVLGSDIAYPVLKTDPVSSKEILFLLKNTL
jgi:hypothetical protein